MAYDFQAAGEFVAAATPDGSIQVQVRQEPVSGAPWVTINTAVAADVAGDRVGVYAAEPAYLVVNGRPVEARDAARALPNGGMVERHADLVTVTWPGGTRLSVNCWGPMLDVSLAPSAADGPALRGLFGSADGDPANDLTGRDGRVLDRADSAFFDLLHHQFGESWRIEPADSLFEYAPA